VGFAINPPNAAIVSSDGRPTAEFYRFLAQIQRALGNDLIDDIIQSSILTYAPSSVLANERVLSGGVGLTLDIGGVGATMDLDDTAVVPDTYGAADKVVVFTVDAQGRLISASELALNSDNVAEGLANLFFTNTRARSALSGGVGINYNSTTGLIATSVVTSSGTYTPTFGNVANVAASTAYPAQWLRVGDTVTVSGRADIDPTAATFTDMSITLPVPSNFANDYECAGTISTNASTDSGLIKADPANFAIASFLASTTASQPFFYTYSYRII
jgi:hypothetical protein